MKTLTEKQAYEAMFFFLEKRFRKLQEDALASLLADMSTLPDGCAADPRIDTFWSEALEFAQNGGVASRLQITKTK